MEDATCENLKLERKSSLRKLGRCRSTMLASELIPSGIANNIAYERLSQSMRLLDEPTPRRNKWRKNKAWVFLMRVFSIKKMEGDDMVSEESVDARENKLEVVAEMKKIKSQSSWGRGGEITQKPAEVLIVEKKKRQATFLPDPYRRWPV